MNGLTECADTLVVCLGPLVWRQTGNSNTKFPAGSRVVLTRSKLKRNARARERLPGLKSPGRGRGLNSARSAQSWRRNRGHPHSRTQHIIARSQDFKCPRERIQHLFFRRRQRRRKHHPHHRQTAASQHVRDRNRNGLIIPPSVARRFVIRFRTATPMRTAPGSLLRLGLRATRGLGFFVRAATPLRLL